MIKKYKAHIGIIITLLTFTWWLFTIDATASEALKIAEQNSNISKQLSAIVVENDTKLSMFLEFSGFDKECADKWAAIPRRLPVDSVGNPLLGVSWLRVSEDLKVGILYIISKDSVTKLDTLWNIQKD